MCVRLWNFNFKEMGHEHHHQATDGLVSLFTKANHDLNVVQFKLEKEFQQLYPDNVNPIKLVNRIKKVQEDLTFLNQQCRDLLAAKQDLIDKARTSLIGNRNLLRRMQASMGISLVTDSDDAAFANFNQIIDEWTEQVRSRSGDERNNSDSSDVNKLLFSAIVQSN
ncbi:hypothetical protein K2173_023161 [Erythroxylum novogranatense]|uniref:Protein FAM33A n=1 Tax=Erythroxylum novogranatense TaxID=1862640 RepID=A0AAV8U926_9ROSI|nr:hypothetical protein K2173_023161 [Erythroxylum novogranatense]